MYKTIMIFLGPSTQFRGFQNYGKLKTLVSCFKASHVCLKVTIIRYSKPYKTSVAYLSGMVGVHPCKDVLKINILKNVLGEIIGHQ